MEATVSTKYQVVIPKSVRKQLGLQPGQKVTFGAVQNGHVMLAKELTAAEVIEKYRGALRKAWGSTEDPAIAIRRMRDTEWG